MSKILIVDDEEIVRFALSEKLEENGFSVLKAFDGRNAVDVFGREAVDAVLLDLRMPGMNGIETMHELKRLDPDVPIIIVTAYGDIPTAVQAIKLGAYDFIEKPPPISKLIVTLQRATEKLELERKVKRLDTTFETSLVLLMGRSKVMKRVIEQIKQVSWSDMSVMLQGETGTGKSFIANTIHNLSKRAGKEFVRVDIGVIPESLVESELFGHEKGAFTGADRKKKGYFEFAHGGTIFIDELQNMSPIVQTKLLSVVEEKKAYPLGSVKPLDIDARIITATNKDMKESVAENKFREDLFFRLGEFIITLPPLRERSDDIPFLSRKFMIEAETEMNKQIKEMDDNALDYLTRYNWPGNIRELRNVIRRAVLLTEDGVIRNTHIELLIEESDEKKETLSVSSLFPLKAAVTDTEKRALRHALRVTNGNKKKAASLLNIDYKTLLSKIKEYGIFPVE
ncbi:MAG TPA: sigma-54-dependent Fis family transcriptional regulator [Nitrospiraceae bacterium]|nr:sigma-54-dependent Fis family transcriptional regulator [Nitrospiraceae bacterium]